ncbi:ribosomal protein S18-alanine N-acetyltransferase [Enterococcus olivae]
MLKKFKSFLPFFLRSGSSYLEKTQIIEADSYTIREMTPGDIKELIQLERLVYDGHIPWTKSAFLSELYSRHVHQYLCLLIEDQIIGFVGVRVVFDDGHLTNIAILPEHQNKGLGSLLMNEAEQFARKNRCQTMSLEVRLSNRDAQRIYRKHGFESRRILTAYYNEGNEDALDMVKFLK